MHTAADVTSCCDDDLGRLAWLQADQLTRHLQIEQEKASQDRTAWDKREAELLHDLGESMDSAQRNKVAQTSLEEEYSHVQVSMQLVLILCRHVLQARYVCSKLLVPYLTQQVCGNHHHVSVCKLTVHVLGTTARQYTAPASLCAC